MEKKKIKKLEDFVQNPFHNMSDLKNHEFHLIQNMKVINSSNLESIGLMIEAKKKELLTRKDYLHYEITQKANERRKKKLFQKIYL